MSDPLISIIIPSRNREIFLRDLINDLFKQELSPAEIIVVDQSERPYQGLPCIHIVDQVVGPCHARNLGITAATGDILVFLDDDIRIEKDFVRLLCEPIINEGYLAVTGAICDKEGNYPFQNRNYWRKANASWLLAFTANPDFPGKSPTLSFPTGCSAISSRVVSEIGGFDEYFDPDGAGEDREYALRIFHSGYSILYNGSAKARHLAAPSGGRRSEIKKGLSALELNSMYIVAKYFNDEILTTYCNEWLYIVKRRYLTLNPKSWWRTYHYWQFSLRWIEKIRSLKHQNNWE